MSMSNIFEDDGMTVKKDVDISLDDLLIELKKDKKIWKKICGDIGICENGDRCKLHSLNLSERGDSIAYEDNRFYSNVDYLIRHEKWSDAFDTMIFYDTSPRLAMFEQIMDYTFFRKNRKLISRIYHPFF